MAKKQNKALKRLRKDVSELREQNEGLAEAVAKARKDQAAAYQDLRSFLEERLPVQDAAPVEQEDDARDDSDEEPEATEAAARRAEELNVDLSDVKGTGSSGRILVTDVEAAADAK